MTESKKKLRRIFLGGFFFATSMAFAAYINSSFLGNFIDEKLVGIIFTISSLISIFGLLKLPLLLKKIGNYRSIIIFIIINLFSLLGMIFGTKAIFIIPSFILYYTSFSFMVLSLDVFVEKFSDRNAIGKTRGLYLTAVNSAWVISPFLSGFILNKTSFATIYACSFIFMFIVATIIRKNLKNFQDPQYEKISLRQNLKTIFKNKNLSKIYSTNLILQFFYSWMVIYTPIYLNSHLNFGWDKIGIIFTIMLLPFVLFEYTLGKLSDKIGEKKILTIGLIIISLSTLSIFFINSQSILIWATILFLTRTGASAVEIMNESYFFKQITTKDTNIISFFRNASPIAYIIGPALATLFLAFLPFKSIFLILGLIVFSGIYFSLTLRDTK